MKKDIPIRKVKDIAIAITPPEIYSEDAFWDVFIVNLKQNSVHNVLINSKGYGDIDGKPKVTETFRYFYDQIPPGDYTRIEQIDPSVLELTNQFWVSYTEDDYLFDRKYIFVRGALEEFNFTTIPILNKRGVMIK